MLLHGKRGAKIERENGERQRERENIHVMLKREKECIFRSESVTKIALVVFSPSLKLALTWFLSSSSSSSSLPCVPFDDQESSLSSYWSVFS